MKKIVLLVVVFLSVLLITGCDLSENQGINKSISKTSITKKGLKSYRCKVSINSKDDSISYIVLNNNNKNYVISLSTKDGMFSYEIKEGRVIAKDNSYINNNYDYTNTDMFINGLANVEEKSVKTEKIDKKEYMKYEFNISKSELNKMLSSFNMKAKKDGNGFVYIDKDNHIYIIKYLVDDITMNISYTSYNDVK